MAQQLASNPESIANILSGYMDPEVGDDGEPIPPGAHVVNVTPEERAAIERVGFSPIYPQMISPDCRLVGSSWLSPTCCH